MTQIAGKCAAGFDRVEQAFAANFASGEHGAGLCVVLDGRPVVDVWGGFTDEARQSLWQRDTLVNCFSVGKGVLAILALDCIGRGEVELDAALYDLWPEAASLGPKMTLRTCLSHRAGVPAVRRRLADDVMYHWETMCAAIVDQQPYWDPDSAHGYHVNTWGFLVGEILRRATGTPVRELFRERIALPVAADFHFGLPATEHHRVAKLIMPEATLSTPEEWALAFPATGDAEHDAMVWHSYFNPNGLSGIGTVNTPAWRSATIPSTNSHADARGIAHAYSALEGTTRHVISKLLRAEAASIHSEGLDRVLSKPSAFGLGFQLGQSGGRFGPNPAAFGHYGYGGSLGMYDPDNNLAVGYVTNKPGARFDTARTQGILDALYPCL